MLVGSQSFWEGIDVPGDALQCVLIDKLPFPPPNDPLVRGARQAARSARAATPFNEYFVAEAAVSLKQGAGRLIRSETDRGLLVVCDPRMRQMNYGARLRAALPPMTRLTTKRRRWRGWPNWPQRTERAARTPACRRPRSLPDLPPGLVGCARLRRRKRLFGKFFSSTRSASSRSVSRPSRS